MVYVTKLSGKIQNIVMPGGKESDFLCLDLFLGFRCLKIKKNII